MKRFVCIIALAAICIGAAAQAQITTKKEKLSDFLTKTTKIVSTGNEILDQELMEAVRNSWTITPYEYCTLTEFETLRKGKDFYFLVPVTLEGRKGKDLGVRILKLVKGGEGKSIDDMLEVVSVPFCAADSPSGREATMLTGVLDIVQNYVNTALVSGFKKLKSDKPVRKTNRLRLVFARSEIAPSADSLWRSQHFDSNILVLNDEGADEFFLVSAPSTVVSYVVAPEDPQKGAICYKMLIDARTHELYYYKKSTVRKPSERGFTKADLRKITAGR